MSDLIAASRAYATAAGSRNPRAQEADVFRRATAALRQAKGGSDITRVRALADNDRLWGMVTSVLKDPDNKLPPPLRATMISIGRAVQRNMQSASPDFDFLVQVNEDIAAGLSGEAA
jgi:flagellar biosynthesis regulator FlaF